MNAYDFDKTILKGNSVQRFFFFCALRLPYLWLLMPFFLVALLLRLLHIISYERFLRALECFVLFVPRKEKFVQNFWNSNIRHIKQWYLDVREDNDLIISASPYYEISVVCNRLNVQYLCSVSNPKTYLVQGPHCYGEQKVIQYKKHFGDTPPETYYSDSMSDVPMFKFAKRGYLVKGNKITLVYENGERVQN